LKFRKTRRCSITANNLLRFSVGIALVFSALSVAADCQSGKGITSNDVIAVTGEADTLWTLVWEGPRNQFAVNSIIHGGDSVSLNKDNNWLSYTLGCISSDIHDLAYGDGRLVLCFDTLKFGQPNPVLLLTRNGNSINKQDFSLGWPVDSSSLDLTAREVVWVNNAFYFACMDAGLVRWDYKNQTKSVFSPGKSSSVPVNEFPGLESKPDTMLRVIGLERHENDVMVITPARIWRFSTIDSSWDSSISSQLVNSELNFSGFEAVYPEPGKDGLLLSRIRVKKRIAGSWKDTLILAKYSRTQKNWRSILEQTVYDVAFGPGHYFFVLTEKGISAFQDSLADTLVTRSAVINTSVFQNWITRNFAISEPVLTDLHYVGLTDSTGYLLLASTDGTFLARWQYPPAEKVTFYQVKRAPPVRSGLKQTYARPGVLVADMYDQQSRTVFIYNLSRDANVTIRVYDYNMDLVKTIISNKFRRAGNNGGQHGRSTVENEDWWDGRNSSGKMVAPGVYYYRISTDIGERAFGKIVVAK
jgi:hypothetical protein